MFETANGYSYVTDLSWLNPAYCAEFIEIKTSDNSELQRMERLLKLSGYQTQSRLKMLWAWKSGELPKHYQL